MLDLLWQGLVNVAQWKYLLPLFAGTFVGVIGGSLPGVTITMTVIVVLPFTFGLEPLQGLACMIGVYVGGETGGLITSCLLGIPGKPSAVGLLGGLKNLAQALVESLRNLVWPDEAFDEPGKMQIRLDSG